MKIYTILIASGLLLTTHTASAHTKISLGTGSCPTGVNGITPTIKDMQY